MKVQKRFSWRESLAQVTDFHFYLIILLILLGIVIYLVARYALIAQANFFILGCDTAFFQSGLANTLYGHPFRDTAYDGPNILGIHSFFSILWLLPIYAFAPNADTLFILQILGGYSTFIPLYLVASHVLNSPKNAFILSSTMIPSGMFFEMTTDSFHLETGISAAVLWSYYGYLKNSWLLTVFSMFFAFGCGEQSALIYLAMGLMILWLPPQPKLKFFGTMFVTSSLAWIVISLFILPPLFRVPSQENLFALNYHNWQIQSPLELPVKILLSPWQAILALFDPNRWYFVISLTGFPVILTLFFRRTWPFLLIIPIYFFMSPEQFLLALHSYYFQFLFIAGILALLELLHYFDISSRIGVLALTATLTSNLLSASVFYGDLMHIFYSSDPYNANLHNIFIQLPIEDAVFSPHRFSAYLSNHPNMVMGDLRDENMDFDKMIEERYSTTQVHAADIHFLFVDYITDQCGPRKEAPEYNFNKHRRDNVAKLLKNGEWEQVWSENDVVLLHRIKPPPE